MADLLAGFFILFCDVLRIIALDKLKRQKQKLQWFREKTSQAATFFSPFLLTLLLPDWAAEGTAEKSETGLWCQEELITAESW